MQQVGAGGRFSQRLADCSDLSEIALINPGDILFLYTDGVYDGSNEEERCELEELLRAHSSLSAREICAEVLRYAVGRDKTFIERGEDDLLDDKTAFVIKRNRT